MSAKKFIFRRIRGRLVKINISKAAGKTSLSMKRQKAIAASRKSLATLKDVAKKKERAVRLKRAAKKMMFKMEKKLEAIQSKTMAQAKNSTSGRRHPESIPEFNVLNKRRQKLRNYAGKYANFKDKRVLGEGLENLVLEVNKKAVKIPKTSFNMYANQIGIGNFKAGQISSILSRKKLAPETFTVKTSKRTFIVQDKVKGKGVDLFGEEQKAFSDKIENALDNRLMADDLHKGNVLLGKDGKPKVIDTGVFDFEPDFEDFSLAQKKITDKFTILTQRAKKLEKENRRKLLKSKLREQKHNNMVKERIHKMTDKYGLLRKKKK